MVTDTVLNIKLFSALLLGASVGTVAGYIGSLMITKRMALMGGALGHLALPGIALGLAYGFDISLGAILFLLIGIIGIWSLEKTTRLPFETTTAVIFTSSLALAFLFLPHKEIDIALLGSIKSITLSTAIIGAILCFAVLVIIKIIYKKIVLIGISSDLALVEGINATALNFIYLVCIALVVALGVRIIGGLMTAALVAIPAATSKNISRSLRSYAYLSMLFGGLSCIFGILIASFWSLAVGPMIIICSTAFFAISLIFRKK